MEQRRYAAWRLSEIPGEKISKKNKNCNCDKFTFDWLQKDPDIHNSPTNEHLWWFQPNIAVKSNGIPIFRGEFHQQIGSNTPLKV